ncbi:MAG: outer membrane protein assembly factor BamB [Burkholderiaceae bacterium]
MMNRAARRSVVLAMALAAAGCSLFGSSKPKPAELPAIKNPSTLTVAWRQQIGPAGLGFQPAYAQGSLWAASGKGRVLRVDAESGKLAWEADLGKPLLSGVGTDGEVAVVATRDGNLVALDADGKTRWTAPIDSEAVAVPLVGEGIVVARTSSNRIFAFDAATGDRRWTFQRQNPPLVLRQTQSMTIDAGVVYVGMPGGRIVALSVETGAVRWETAVSQPRGSNEIERIADVVGAVPVVGGRLCAATYQGRFGCFDAGTGRPAWVRDVASSTGPSMDSTMVALVDDKESVQAFTNAGSSAWRNQQYALRGLAAALLTDDAVLFGDANGLVHALGRDDGATIGRVSTDGSAVLGRPVAAGGLVAVQTSSGSLYALRLAR